MRVAQVWAAHPKLSTAIDSQMQQLERAVLLLGQTIALSSMQATTTTAGKQFGAPTTQAVLPLAGPHVMLPAGRRLRL